ncbi:MAG: UPF0149 family protein [Agarilytica sp.]
MPASVDFFHLNELLLNLGAVHSPSELQGMLCGRISGGSPPEKDQWLALAQEFLDIDHLELDQEQAEAFFGLYTDTRSLMDDVNFSFSPLLPDDHASIARRTQELGTWCQGFMHGLGVSGLSGDAQLSPDSADALRDLAQISQVDLDEEDAVEENESYWLELVEYVKVAALTIYTELTQSHNAAGNGGKDAAGSGAQPGAKPQIH